MQTHSEYHVAYPLPAFIAPLRVERVVEPPLGIGRVHRIKEHGEDGEAIAANIADPLPTDAYIAALSLTEWRSARQVAEILGVNKITAYCRLTRRPVAKHTERKRSDSGRAYLWRLK